MTAEGTPRPFHERFDIPLEDTEVKRRFIYRLSLLFLDDFWDELEVAGVDIDRYFRSLQYVIGDRSVESVDNYIGDDFHRCLRVVEAMYQIVGEADIRELWSAAIHKAIRDSETDLGIDWQPPIFVRTGARLLDQSLVNEPMRWLSAPRYQAVLEPFQRGLSHYLAGRLADTVTDMYEAVEALARVVTERNRELSSNREMFISSIGASDYYKQLLRDYIAYANQYRHAAQQDRPRPPLSEPEVESFIYLTGLFIRLAIRTT